MEVLIDQPIKFTDLNPLEKANLQASMVDERDILWTASINGMADERGVFQDMTSIVKMEPPAEHLIQFHKKKLTPQTIHIKLNQQTSTITQHQYDPAVEIHSIENGIFGKLFIPPGEGPFPGVIVLSGSTGGLRERRAALLASHGFVAFALAYFNAKGVPDHLENIPLEYFKKGIDYLNQHPKVNNVSLMGISRGGELALLLGTLYPVEKIVAYVPNAAVYGGVPDETRPSWTLNGIPLPIAPFPSRQEIEQTIDPNAPISITPFFLKEMHQKAFDQALIPVEKIQADLLLISGDEDAMWPSSTYCQMIMDRLNTHRSPTYRKHLSYPHAGHTIQPPYVPTTRSCALHPIHKLYYEMGGTPEGTAHANEDSWKKILAFLKSHKG